MNEKYNEEIFSSHVLWGKADGAEQKIREFKRLLFKSNKAHKATSTSSRFNPKRLIRKATGNMNIIQSQKYGHPLEVIKENARSEKFSGIYDFCRPLKVQKNAKRCEKRQIVMKTAERITQSRLESGCLGKKFEKKDALKHICKSTMESISFFTCEQILVVRKVGKTSR